MYIDKNNIAPRVGLAWSPGDAKNVLRAGAGIFYSYPDMNLWCNQVHNVPLVFPEIQVNNAATPAVGFGFAPPVLGQTLTGFTAIDTHLQIPRIDQASVSFERQLTATSMVQVGYLGAWGSSLDRRAWSTTRSPVPAACSHAVRFRRSRSCPDTDLGTLPPDVTVRAPRFRLARSTCSRAAASRSTTRSGFSPSGRSRAG